MFESLEVLPKAEVESRHTRLRHELKRLCPDAGGMLVFSRPNIYYLSGCLASGVMWLPLEGDPVLLVRKGIGRAQLESPLQHIYEFRSYSQLKDILAEAGSPLTPIVAAAMNGLPWSLGNLLTAKLKGTSFLSGDMSLAVTKAVKSPWELEKIRLTGARHHKGLHDILPERIQPGMTEREISIAVWNVFFELGHQGIMRMENDGEEIFLGHISAGDSANYPSVFNGPVGLRGEHPAIPFMGYAGKVWQKGEPLTIDVGFILEGYHTDKTQVYYAGKKVPDDIQKAHDVCIEVQNFASSKLKAGGVPSAVYADVLQLVEKAGMSEGFMGLGKNKVPFLGHGIGLSIDGYPVIARGFDEPVEERMTIALEPKMGIAGVGMVGVENTFEVTSTSAVCITGDAFNIVTVE
ncbi:M24 family metallopeptidase [Desulfovibrio inopinatus]|uniref:M24 family metallopeptidase n=1 Tax=Desulfovibrio inopinatus TaxID=102109 RepID=UPI0004188705|nr:M24 family metallopeptidase [Desulfovibrio inopinatus]